MKIGDRIKKLRISKEWTQTELGEKINLTCGTVSGIEAGRSQPTAEVVVKISELFDVSTDYLLTGKEAEGNLESKEREVLNLYRNDAEVQKEINTVLEEKKNMMFRFKNFFINQRLNQIPIAHKERRQNLNIL